MKENLNFITTKLKMPLPRTNYIKRDTLYTKLDSMDTSKVTLIMGAAGSGKTTLLTSFIKERYVDNFKWITLDKSNNDVFSFWNYFFEAMKDFLGQEKDSIMSLFNGMMHKENLDDFIAILINQLDKQDNIILVLDDFHFINDTRLLQMIEFFIKYSSDNVHIVILTREEPSLYLTDLLMAGKMFIVREEDLKLTEQEGICFLKDTLKMDMSDECMLEMIRISEGWVGGLQLIALASISNKSRPIKDIKVLNQYVIDYLSKEILDSLGEDIKHFLINTSILTYFDVDICNKLLDISSSEEIIAELTARNLFIIDSGENEKVFRYHNIFGEFLRLQFSKQSNIVKKTIRIKASKIFEQIGNLDESIKHLFEIEEYSEAMRVIESVGQNSQGWVYLSKIPVEFIIENEEMAFQRIFYHFCAMEWEECRDLMNFIESKIKNRKMWVILEFSRALIDNTLIDEIDASCLEEIEKMGLSDVTKEIIYLKLSMFLEIKDRYKEALDLLSKTLLIESKLNNPYIKYFALSLKSQVKEDIGELRECVEIYAEIFSLLNRYKFLSFLNAASYIGVAGVYLKNLNLVKAEEYLTKAQNISKITNTSVYMGLLYNLMELKVLKGENDEALEIIDLMTGDEASRNLIYTSALLKYLLYLNHTDSEIMNNFIVYCKGRDKKQIRIEDKLFYSRVLYYNNQIQESLDLVNEVLQETRKKKVKITMIEALLFKIHILNESFNDNEKELLNIIREAIHYSYENAILSPYFLEYKNINKLLILLNQKRSDDLNLQEKNFINEIINLGTSSEGAILSNREMEVLCELATGASNKEIAQKMYISVSTVKTHIVNIFYKLNVSNRIEAIDKSRKQGILH